MLSSVLIFLLLFFNYKDTDQYYVHAKHVLVNGSLEKLHLNNESTKQEEHIKRVTPPPIVEVIHGKVNSVIHEIRGSIDDIPPLFTETKPKDELILPTNLKQNSLSVKLTELESSSSTASLDAVIDEALLTRAASALIENTTTSQHHQPAVHQLSAASSGTVESALPSILSAVEPTLDEPQQPPVGSPSVTDEEPVPPAPAVAQPINGTTKDDQPHDDIPSFSEWAKQQMAEAEKNKGENLTVGTVKVKRLKNYASPDCGAKVVASNPEAQSASAILSPSRDDYMLNACNVKIWFVVELCEAIQMQRIEIANFELFSSSPKEFSISVSDRFPTRDWTLVKSITAKDERNVQSFPLLQISHFAKYVRIELHSHYGTEHYCPISLFKAYGTSELEVLDNVDNGGDVGDDDEGHPVMEPYDDDEEDSLAQTETRYHASPSATLSTADLNPSPGAVDSSVVNSQGDLDGVPSQTDDSGKGGGNNLLGTAKAAVLSIVKKAAEVLVVKGGENNGTCDDGNLNGVGIKNDLTTRYCFTPAYLIVCTNCADDLYNRIYEYLSCNGSALKTMLSNSFIYRSLLNSRLCADIGLNLGSVSAAITQQQQLSPKSYKTTQRDPLSAVVDYLNSFLKTDTIAALCNYLAVSERKVSLNTSQSFEEQVDGIAIVSMETDLLPATSHPPETTIVDPEKTKDVLTGQVETAVESSSLNSPSESGIIPTKTLPTVSEPPSPLFQNTSEESAAERERPSTAAENSTVQLLDDLTISAVSPSSDEAVLTTVVPTPATPTVNIKETLDINETQANGLETQANRLETQVTDPSPPSQLQPATVPTVPATNIAPPTEEVVVDPLTLESLFLDEETTTSPNARSTSSQSSSMSGSTTTQKESVFVRLANRIKALEVNMSLSSQYLEELSRRYKKQVEELQRTLSGMVDERRSAADREAVQSAHINALNLKIDTLTVALAELISERDSKASMLGQHGLIIFVEVIVFLVVLGVCRWLGSVKSNAGHSTEATHPQHPGSKQRRHSMDSVDGLSVSKKVRRPSEEACVPSGKTHEELLVDAKRKTSREGARSRRKRRRKERWEDEGIVLVGPDSEEKELVTSTDSSIVAATVTVATVTTVPVTAVSATTAVNHNYSSAAALPASSSVPMQPTADYRMKTALWTRAKRSSTTSQPQHPQAVLTTSSQETLNSLQLHQQQLQSHPHKSSSSSTATTASFKSTRKAGGTIKKIVKKFF